MSSSLLTPMVLCFFLGIISARMKGDLKLPSDLYSAITIYLLLAIGLKGGVKLGEGSISEMALPILASLAMGVGIPIWIYAFLSGILRFDKINSAALAAHYGSVSVVTFAAASMFLDTLGVRYEGYIISLLAILEVPGILVALLIARFSSADSQVSLRTVLHELISGRSIVLLVGGMAIGLAVGMDGYSQVSPFFEAPFKGVLSLFLLEMGIVTGKRFEDIYKIGFRLLLFGLLAPLVNSLIGALVGYYSGLSLGGTTLLSVLAASASYIAAPAAVRMALPEANPGIYITSSLAITFPFNIIFGIPLYYFFVEYLFRV